MNQVFLDLQHSYAGDVEMNALAGTELPTFPDKFQFVYTHAKWIVMNRLAFVDHFEWPSFPRLSHLHIHDFLELMWVDEDAVFPDSVNQLWERSQM